MITTLVPFSVHRPESEYDSGDGAPMVGVKVPASYSVNVPSLLSVYTSDVNVRVPVLSWLMTNGALRPFTVRSEYAPGSCCCGLVESLLLLQPAPTVAAPIVRMAAASVVEVERRRM